MKAFLDTSVLVPVFYENHEHHQASLSVFTHLDKQEACCGAHSLLEVYATLTGQAGKYRASPEQAMLFISSIRQRLSAITLDVDEYAEVLQSCAEHGVAGGTIYDAQLARCALKADAATIYSWNLRHYRQFGPEVTQRLRTPAQAIS